MNKIVIAGGGIGGQILSAVLGAGAGRTWLRVAKDPGADGDAEIAMSYAPVVRLADGTRRQLTNNELTLGVRFLLDLEA